MNWNVPCLKVGQNKPPYYHVIDVAVNKFKFSIAISFKDSSLTETQMYFFRSNGLILNTHSSLSLQLYYSNLHLLSESTSWIFEEI